MSFYEDRKSGEGINPLRFFLFYLRAADAGAAVGAAVAGAVAGGDTAAVGAGGGVRLSDEDLTLGG